jgi:hypothetical protein
MALGPHYDVAGHSLSRVGEKRGSDVIVLRKDTELSVDPAPGQMPHEPISRDLLRSLAIWASIDDLDATRLRQ